VGGQGGGCGNSRGDGRQESRQAHIMGVVCGEGNIGRPRGSGVHSRTIMHSTLLALCVSNKTARCISKISLVWCDSVWGGGCMK